MFRFEASPGESHRQDFEVDRSKLTYFLLCPGPCDGRLGFPTKPHYDNVARYQVTCSACRSECSHPGTQSDQWRRRIPKAICNECENTFKTCVCQAPYETTEMSLHTPKGVAFRAAYRARKKREGLWFCGACYEVVDVETISAREWEKIQSGQRSARSAGGGRRTA